MTNQHDDHEHHDAHVVSLRLALGSILSPKRSSSSRSSTTTSGSSSPMHSHHHASSAAHSHMQTTLSSPEMAHTPLPSEHHHSTNAAGFSSRAARIPLPRTQTENNLATKVGGGSSDGIPQAVPSMVRPSSVPVSPISVSSVPSEDPSHPQHQTRADFMGTLRSKSAWDALIHGTFV